MHRFRSRPGFAVDLGRETGGKRGGWWLAGLLGVDLYAMQAAGMAHGHAADLPGYRKIDPYFRDL